MSTRGYFICFLYRQSFAVCFIDQINIIVMRQNKAYFNNEKMSKIIALSCDYKKHREIITNIKPVVQFADVKHMKRIAKLSIEKDKYWNNVRNLKISELKKQNDGIIKRILKTGSPLKKQLSPSSSKKKQLKTLEHTSSNKSFKSVSSEKSCASNFRRRTLRQVEIENENKKIAQRILHPKMAKDINFTKMAKLYEKEQSYSRIRSRFSDRSQTIMESLAFGNLKFDQRNVQFLPQLSFKKLPHHTLHKNKTTRDSNNKKDQSLSPALILPLQ